MPALRRGADLTVHRARKRSQPQRGPKVGAPTYNLKVEFQARAASDATCRCSFQLSQKNGELSESIVNTQHEKASLLASLQVRNDAG